MASIVFIDFLSQTTRIVRSNIRIVQIWGRINGTWMDGHFIEYRRCIKPGEKQDAGVEILGRMGPFNSREAAEKWLQTEIDHNPKLSSLKK